MTTGKARQVGPLWGTLFPSCFKSFLSHSRASVLLSQVLWWVGAEDTQKTSARAMRVILHKQLFKNTLWKVLDM